MRYRSNGRGIWGVALLVLSLSGCGGGANQKDAGDGSSVSSVRDAHISQVLNAALAEDAKATEELKRILAVGGPEAWHAVYDFLPSVTWSESMRKNLRSQLLGIRPRTLPVWYFVLFLEDSPSFGLRSALITDMSSDAQVPDVAPILAILEDPRDLGYPRHTAMSILSDFQKIFPSLNQSIWETYGKTLAEDTTDANRAMRIAVVLRQLGDHANGKKSVMEILQKKESAVSDSDLGAKRLWRAVRVVLDSALLPDVASNIAVAKENLELISLLPPTLRAEESQMATPSVNFLLGGCAKTQEEACKVLVDFANRKDGDIAPMIFDQIVDKSAEGPNKKLLEILLSNDAVLDRLIVTGFTTEEKTTVTKMLKDFNREQATWDRAMAANLHQLPSIEPWLSWGTTLADKQKNVLQLTQLMRSTLNVATFTACANVLFQKDASLVIMTQQDAARILIPSNDKISKDVVATARSVLRLPAVEETKTE